MTDYLILIPLGYLLGAVPVGLIAGKVFGRVDVREYGSGKMGMTNVMRTVGVPVAVFVLLLDMGKGVVAVVLARIISDSAGVESAVALAALFGHNWPVFIGFRGGRGTATGWGTLLILWPVAGLVSTLVGLPLVGISRYVSLGSIVATVVGCVMLIVAASTGLVPMGYIWYAIIGGTLVVVRPRDNIQRLIKGEERKIGQSAKAV